MNGVDFRGMIQSTVGAKFPTGTLVKYSAGAYNASDPAAGTSKTSMSYSPNMDVQSYESKFVDGDQARGFDAVINVFLGSLAPGIAPQVGDSITFLIPGSSSATDTGVVYSAKTSPNGASCLCKVHA